MSDIAEHDAEHSRATTDHDRVREWAEEHDGEPARVEGGGDDGTTDLRLRFSGATDDEGATTIDWETFFEAFEAQELAFVYHEEPARENYARFHRFVDRDSVET